MKGRMKAQPVRLRRKPLARSVSAASVAAAMAGAPVAPALAQGVLEEVIVTATKREESVQDVPLAITALSGEFTEGVNLNDVKDLISFTPGITGNSQDSFIDAVSVRGVRTQDFGVGGDPSAAIFKNDRYEGRNGSAVTSLYDIERAEVLRGPQGFLFGRNAIGGAISVHTRKAEPGVREGFAHFDVAERGRFVFEGALNVPTGDNSAIRLAAYHSQEDGFVQNHAAADNPDELAATSHHSTDGDLIAHEKQGFRFSTTYAGEAVNLQTMVEYEDREQSGSVYRAVETGDTFKNLNDVLQGDDAHIDLRGGEEDADTDQSFGDRDDSTILTLGARVEFDLGWATLSSNTGYKDHDFFYTEDYDGTPLNINNYQVDQEGDYFQEEVRLTSNSDGMFSWYAGASYYEEEIDATFINSGDEDLFCNYYGNYYYPGNNITGCASLYTYYGGDPFEASEDGLLTEPGTVRGKYQGWAAYVDLNFALSERFDVGLGVRYTEDEKDFSIDVPQPESNYGPSFAYGFTTDGALESSDSWSDTQSRLNARFRPADGHMLFASYTEGFKSGGFGSFAIVDKDGVQVGTTYPTEADPQNTGLTQAAGFRSRKFRPEESESWEFGYKGALGNADLSLTGFLYDYEDLQISFFSEDSGANTVENVGQVDGVGIEGSLNARLGDYWSLYLALSYLDTEATGLQDVCDSRVPLLDENGEQAQDMDGNDLSDTSACEGSPLFWAPEWAGAAVLKFNYPAWGGRLTGSLEAFWESERGGGWGGYEETMIDDNTEMALRLGFASGEPGEPGWNLGLYVENLTDSFTYDGQNNNGGILPSHFFGHRRPRTLGATFGFAW